MIESVIMALIYLCLLAVVVYIVIWVLGEIGIVIPPQVMKLLWIIVTLVAILFIIKTLLPGLGIRIGSLGYSLLV